MLPLAFLILTPHTAELKKTSTYSTLIRLLLSLCLFRSMSLYNNKWRNWSCHLIWTSCREKICTFKSQLKWTEIHTEISTTYFVLKVDFRSHDHLCKCLCKAYKCVEKLHYKGYFLVLISNSLLTTIRFPFPPTPPWLSNLQFLLSTQLKTLLSLYFFPTNLLKKIFCYLVTTSYLSCASSEVSFSAPPTVHFFSLSCPVKPLYLQRLREGGGNKEQRWLFTTYWKLES